MRPRLALHLSLLALLLGCASTPPAIDAAFCSRFDAVKHAADQGRPVVLGEIHGTQEFPRLTGDLAQCFAADGTLPVLLLLELNPGQEPGIARFLASAGKQDDVCALLSHWEWGLSDGRSSIAMFELLDRVRQARQRGSRIEVRTIMDRDDRGYADRVRMAMKDVGRARALVLVGNEHANRGESFLGPSKPPTAALLADLDPLSLVLFYLGGTHWGKGMDSVAGVHSLGGDDAPARSPERFKYPSMRLIPWGEGRFRFDGAIQLGRVSASLPARTLCEGSR